jgi:hypothetical protein
LNFILVADADRARKSAAREPNDRHGEHSPLIQNDATVDLGASPSTSPPA